MGCGDKNEQPLHSSGTVSYDQTLDLVTMKIISDLDQRQRRLERQT